MIKKTFVLIIVLLVVVYNATVFYVDKNIQDKVQASTYNSCHKVWSSRGFYNTIEERNSLTSLRRAFSLGYIGAEVDLFYDIKTNRFIISHDRPEVAANNELIYTKKDGQILTLEKLLMEVGKDHYFWLDYKNLDRLSPEVSVKAIARLLKITELDNVRDRIYIEGSNPLRLSKYTDAGFKTILGMHPPHESAFLSSFTVHVFKMVYYFNNITALAMNYGSAENPIYGEKTEYILQGIPVFLFHIKDDEKLLNRLKIKKDVRVLLVDGAVNVNKAYINKCDGVTAQ